MKPKPNRVIEKENCQKIFNHLNRFVLLERNSRIQSKWQLRTGRKVEDIIYDEGKYEAFLHLYHSNIVSLQANNLGLAFIKSEIEEISIASGKKELERALPRKLIKMLSYLENKSTWQEMNFAFQRLNLNRMDQPEEYWCMRSILDYFNLFYRSIRTLRFISRYTLFSEMYTFILYLQDICGIQSERLTKRMLLLYEVTTPLPDEKLIFLFKHNGYEIGQVTSQVGHLWGKKESVIQNKTKPNPTRMRDLCWIISNKYKIKHKGIKIVSFEINGPYITVHVMSFEHGAIGVMYSSPTIRMPTKIEEVNVLLPDVLKLVYNAAQIMKRTVRYIETASQVVKEDFDQWDFPTSFEEIDNDRLEKNSLPFSYDRVIELCNNQLASKVLN